MICLNPMSNCNQYISIAGYDSSLAAINCGMPHRLFIYIYIYIYLSICINDLNQAIKFCKVQQFAEDTNLICMSTYIKKLNKLVYADLKHLISWLNANKISLNVKKKLKW